MSSETHQRKSLLLALPSEIRLQIYRHLDFSVKINLKRHERGAQVSLSHLGILRASRLLRREALPLLATPTHLIVYGDLQDKLIEIPGYDFSAIRTLEIHGHCNVAADKFSALTRLTLHSSEIAFYLGDIFEIVAKFPKELQGARLDAGLVRQIQSMTLVGNIEIKKLFEDQKRKFKLVIAQFGIYMGCNMCETRKECEGGCWDIVKFSLDYELDMESRTIVNKVVKRDVHTSRDPVTGLCKRFSSANIVP